MYILDKQIELEGILLYAEVEFDRVAITPATIDPEEGGEIILRRVYVSLAVGETYEVYRRQMGGWEKDLDRLGYEWVQEYMDVQELHDHANDTEDCNVVW